MTAAAASALSDTEPHIDRTINGQSSSLQSQCDEDYTHSKCALKKI